jgi:hypothetical protein
VNGRRGRFKFVKSHGLEGVVPSVAVVSISLDFALGSGPSTGSISGRNFVVGPYTPGTHGFDALILGFYHLPTKLTHAS